MTLRAKVLLACSVLLALGTASMVFLFNATRSGDRRAEGMVRLHDDALAAHRLAQSVTELRIASRTEMEAPSAASRAAFLNARAQLGSAAAELKHLAVIDDPIQSADELASERVAMHDLDQRVAALERACDALQTGALPLLQAGDPRDRMTKATQAVVSWTSDYASAKERELTARLAASARVRAHVRWVAILISGGGLLAGVFLLIAVVAPLRKGLMRIAHAAQDLKAGDLNSRLPEGDDELGMVSAEFNAMAVELQRMRDSLEEAVLERTRQLFDTNRDLQLNLARLDEMQSRLAVSDRLASIGRLAAGVGHELNNPLAFVLTNLRYVSEELASGAGAEEDLREALGEATQGAERMAAIVRDLRVMSHGNIDALQALELVPVLQSASTIALSNARERVELVRDFAVAPMVIGNPVKLGQVFLNLLMNAAQALEGRSGRAPRIDLRTAIAGDGRVHVTIADNGSGIAPDHLGHIFEPFFTTKPVGVGTGLGLSICHTIVTSLGGEIRVQSTQGVGTTFTVILPNGNDGTDEITRRLDLATMKRVA